MIFQSFSPTQTQLRRLEAKSGENLCVVFRLEGFVDESKLAQAIESVIQRTVVFSHRFLSVNESLQIVVTSDLPEGLTVMDVASDDETNVLGLIRSLLTTPFRLDGGAPYNFCLLRGQKTRHLIYTCHPALMDGFSLKKLFTAISDAYAGKSLPDELGLAQEQLLQAENELLQGPQKSESVRFWMQLVKDASFEWRPPRLEGTPTENFFTLSAPTETLQGLQNLAQSEGLKLDDLILFCFHLFMHRLTRNDAIVTSQYHRISTGSPTLIGFNENKPVVKSAFDSSMTARKYFRLQKRLYQQTLRHSDLPAREMTREARRLYPDFERPTNVLFTPDLLPYEDLQLTGVKATLLPFYSYRLDREDLGVFFSHRSFLEFNILTKSPQQIATVKLAFDHFLAFLQNIPSELDKSLNDLSCFNETLTRRALSFADGGKLRKTPKDFLSSFVQQVQERPSHIAVTDQHRSLSYKELAQSAEQIAAALTALCKKTPEPLVGLCLQRDARMIQAICGTFYAGAAYLPLDVKMPAERLTFMAKDAGLTAIIADNETKPLIEPLVHAPVFSIDEILSQPPSTSALSPVQVPPTHPAYVIYTSGTTGKPKGVMLERKALATFLASLEGVWERGPGNRWLQFASFNFDASVLEIFNPLSEGGELVIAPAEVRTDPEALLRFIQERRVTHACIPPAMMPLLPRRPVPELKSIFCGGEVIDEEAARFWSKVLDLGNCYGPTEATVMCTLNRLKGYKTTSQLGRPLRGYQTYLLDEQRNLAPLGGVGEICIGGEALARGYMGRPELTEQKFIPNPFGPGRLYRTGDLARFLANGDLEFLGRNDFQVKIRGFRIELGDIESAISEQPEVRGTYVAVTDLGGDKHLTAWYASSRLSPERLRQRLAERLPHYMVPSFLVRMESFPLNVNGKIDRTRLPQPSQNQKVDATETMDELELRIRDVWAKVLKVPAASIHLESHFFHLGGHSLLAAGVCSRLNKEMDLEIRPKLLFETPVFADFCTQVRSLPKTARTLPPLRPAGVLAAPVESRLIALIYSRASLYPKDNMYNVVMRVDFDKPLDLALLQKAVMGFLRDHPVFRCYFHEKKGRLWVEADETMNFHLPCRQGSDDDCDKALQAAREVALGVTAAPLWQAELVETPRQIAFIFNIHHVLFDGWSLNLMMEELAARYETASTGKEFTATRLNWIDYCFWAQGLQQSVPFQNAVKYWRQKLSSAKAHVELPVVAFQKIDDSNQSQDVILNADLVSRLKKMAQDKNMTLSPLLFSLYLTWIWRLSDQTELICSYPNAGRDIPGTEEIFGTFVTMGFLRQSLSPHQPFVDLALQVHQQMLADKEHLLAAPYDAEISGMDSLNLIFSLQTGIGLQGPFGPSHFRAEEAPSKTSKGDIAGIFYEELDGSIRGRIEFDASILSPEMMKAFISHFEILATSAVQHPQYKISDLAYQSDAESSRLLELSIGKNSGIAPKSITRQFTEIAHKQPQALALVFKERTLSYNQLDSWSDQIAQSLPDLPTESRIGLSFQKSLELVPAILGILKRGYTYVPLDTSYPKERLHFFTSDADLKYILADKDSENKLRGAGLGGVSFLSVAPFANREAAKLTPVSPENMAYIIYTSGSTGLPKGVMIEHHAVVSMVLSIAETLDLKPGCRQTLMASTNFDASVLEMFAPLLSGACLRIIPENLRRDPSMLHEALNEAQITHFLATPALLQTFPRKPLPSLKCLAYGGDVLDETAAKYWAQETNLWSLYGPTETTVAATAGHIQPQGPYRIIGTPLPGYKVYLLNSELQPTPFGAIGEICIAGEGVARGYLKRDLLTLEKFVLDPFSASPYENLYRTGDLGRLLSDGTLEFIGRNDNQIKLRGFRIELGEIEARLAAFPSIESAVCSLKGEGSQRHLAAYYLAAKELDSEALRTYLQGSLPEYMIPTFFIHMKAFPVTAGGKLDRKALPTMSGKISSEPPHEGLERQIAEIWEEILCFKGLGRKDNFFHVGGNSLLVVRMQAEVRRRLGLEFGISDFYSAPTIEALASRTTVSSIDLALTDARTLLKPPKVDRVLPTKTPESVLLTGAGGFLGIFLLEELSRQQKTTYCLLRCKTPEAGLEQLRKQAQQSHLTVDFARVQVIPGDLGAPSLGLDKKTWDMLAQKTDAILHCAAFVHHLHSYSTMRAANVEGTVELLNLALENHLKSFCFVSTLTVGAALEGVTQLQEKILPNHPLVDNGYILTKWVGEQLAAQANKDYGLPVVIARPGNITGSTKDGFTNFANNHFWLFNKGCLQMSAYPDVDVAIEMTPVNLLAAAIASLTLSTRSGLLVGNLSNPASMLQNDFFEALAGCGFPMKKLPPKQWQTLLQGIPEDNALTTIREFYLGDLSHAPMTVQRNFSEPLLKQQGTSIEIEEARLIPTYVEYLKKAGFLKW